MRSLWCARVRREVGGTARPAGRDVLPGVARAPAGHRDRPGASRRDPTRRQLCPASPSRRARLTRLALSSRQAAVERYGASAVPTAGITVGLARLLQARECWLLVTGERKASILRRALEAPEGPDCPASYLRRHARLRDHRRRAGRGRAASVPGPDDPGGGGSGGRSSGVDSGATNRPMRSCRRLYARRCGRGPGAWRHTSAPGTAGGLAATVGWAESWPVGQHASPACRGPLSRAPVASPRPGPLSRAVRRRPSSRAACRGPPSRAVRRRTRPPWPWLSPPWRAPPPASRTARPPQPSGPATRVRTAGP